MKNQAFSFTITDRQQKWLAVLNLVQVYSHDAIVLGLKPSMAFIRASIWLIRRHRKSSSVTSSKISLPGSSPSGPRCRRDVIRHEDRNGNECDRAHHKLKERFPCSRRRASLLMGDTSRVLRWPYRNGLHWRPVVDWRESATALRAEEARLVARPQIRISQSTVHVRAPEGTQGSLPDDLPLGTVYFTVLPNIFWLEIQCTRGRSLLRNAQLGAGYAGRIQPFEPSKYTRLSSMLRVPCWTGHLD